MKKILLVVMIVLIGLGGVIYNQTRYVTYEEAVSRVIDNETVEKVVIQSARTGFEFEAEDKEIIDEILGKSLSMKLKKGNDIPSIDYFIYIYATNTDIYRYDIALGKDKVHIWDNYYKIIDDNELYEFIESNKLKWKLDN